MESVSWLAELCKECFKVVHIDNDPLEIGEILAGVFPLFPKIPGGTYVFGSGVEGHT